VISAFALMRLLFGYILIPCRLSNR
jgi:hypothetical protein